MALDQGVALIGSHFFFSQPAGFTTSVYDLNNLTPIGVLHPPQEPGFSDVPGFGSAVALNDDTIFMGHQGSDGVPLPNDQRGSGSVHTFRDDELSPAGTLLPAGAFPNEAPLGFERYGAAIAASNDYAVVGAVFSPTLYVYNAVTQAQIQEIDLSSCDCLPTFSSDDDIRITIDIDGDSAVVGYSIGFGLTDRSIALIVDSASGEVVRELTPSVPPGADLRNFGTSVAIDNGLAAVGAPIGIFDDDLTGDDPTGNVFLFDVANGEQVSLLNPVITPDFSPSLFGMSVALDGDLLLVGAPRTRQFIAGGPFGPGGAQLFRLVPEPTGAALAVTLVVALTSHRRRI